MVIERVKRYTGGVSCSIGSYYCQILIIHYNFPCGQPSL